MTPGSVSGAESGVLVSLDLELRVLAAENDVELGGRVLVDGIEVGRIEPFASAGRTLLQIFHFEWKPAGRQRRLRLETRLGPSCPPLHLRVEWLRLRLRPSSTTPNTLSPPSPPMPPECRSTP
jgi:hypothetical protein